MPWLSVQTIEERWFGGGIGGKIVLECHVYPLNDAGKIVGRVDIKAQNDAEAMRLAREEFPDVALGVWCGARVVGKLEPGEPACHPNISKATK